MSTWTFLAFLALFSQLWGNPPRLTCPPLKEMQALLTKSKRPESDILIPLTRGCKGGMLTRSSAWLPIPTGFLNWPLIAIQHNSLIVDGPLFTCLTFKPGWYPSRFFYPLSWVPETFLARFPVFVVASAYGRRCVSVRSTPKIPTTRQKNPGECQVL